MWWALASSSPDLTPYDLLLCGYMKDAVFVPPLQTIIQGMKRMISETVALITRDALINISGVVKYMIDVCGVNHGANIECL
jgi:hypothetical protein